MKNLNIILIVVTIIFIYNVNSYASDDFTKKISKEYSVSDGTKLKISNKFGAVHIENINENKIYISVEIKIEAKNQEEANKFFEKISISFLQVDTLVQAITELEKSENLRNFSINYNIRMPKNLKLDLENKFGDVFIDQLCGKSYIDVKYGNIKANKLLFGDSKPRSQLNISYGEAEIQETDWLKIVVNFSKLNIKQSVALIVKSKFSKINIDKSVSVVADSKYDDPFRIGELQNIIYTGEYGNLNLGSVSNLVEAKTKFSDIQIDNLLLGFDKVDVELDYGNIDIFTQKNVNFQLDVFCRFGSVNYPGDTNFQKNNERTETRITGFRTSDTKTKSIIKVESKYGSVNIK